MSFHVFSTALRSIRPVALNAECSLENSCPSGLPSMLTYLLRHLTEATNRMEDLTLGLSFDWMLTHAYITIYIYTNTIIDMGFNLVRLKVCS